jgi:hypothetical protein
MKTPPRNQRPRLSRRAFGRLAIAGTGALAVARHAGAGPADGHTAGHVGAQSQPDVTLQKLSPEARARFDSMWQSVMRKHGDRFSEEQKARMRRIIARNVAMLDAVYAVDVKNGDGPATVLRLIDGSTPGRPGGARAQQPGAGARKR